MRIKCVRDIDPDTICVQNKKCCWIQQIKFILWKEPEKKKKTNQFGFKAFRQCRKHFLSWHQFVNHKLWFSFRVCCDFRCVLVPTIFLSHLIGKCIFFSSLFFLSVQYIVIHAWSVQCSIKNIPQLKTQTKFTIHVVMWLCFFPNFLFTHDKMID